MALEPIDKPEEISEVSAVSESEDTDADQETSVTDKFDIKIIEYTDFFPTKDTITVISHFDVDGLLCLSAIKRMMDSAQKNESDQKEVQNLRVFFTSPTKIFNTLAKTIPDLSRLDSDDFQIGQLYICDLSLNRDSLLGASIYDAVKWFDHHEVDSAQQYDSEIDNIELVIDPTASSTTSIICDYFKIGNELCKLADEVDTNKIESENAKRLRSIVGALRLKYSGSKLRKILYDLAIKIASDINSINDDSYNSIIEEYNRWLDDFNKYTLEKIQTYVINDRKIGILETENAAPVYSIYESLKDHSEAPFDIIAIMIHKYFRIGKDKNNKFKNKKYTKLEFRTHNDQEIIELAKLFGGGGHKFASGATVMDGLDDKELLKTIESYFSKQ